MVSAHPSMRSWPDFQFRIAKKLALEPILQFRGPKYEKVTKRTPKWIPCGPTNPSKIDNNPRLDPKVSCWVSLGIPGSPKWYPRVQKLLPRMPKWRLQVQNPPTPWGHQACGIVVWSLPLLLSSPWAVPGLDLCPPGGVVRTGREGGANRRPS